MNLHEIIMNNTIGRYNLLISNNGEYAVEWYSNNKYYTIMLPNFVNKFNEIVQNEMVSRQHFAKIFHLIFSKNSDDFINHPDAAILNYLDDNELNSSKLDKNKIFEFNVKNLLLAYNRWKGTSLKFREVETLCQTKIK